MISLADATTASSAPKVMAIKNPKSTRCNSARASDIAPFFKRENCQQFSNSRKADVAQRANQPFIDAKHNRHRTAAYTGNNICHADTTPLENKR